MSNLAYEVAVRGGILPDTEQFTPYAITIGRNSPTIDFKKLKDKKVVVVYVEAGSLYTASHRIQEYRNPKLDKQIADIEKADIPFGLVAEVRCRNVDEAKLEFAELKKIIRRYPPRVGVWLRMFYKSSSKTVNNSIINYFEKQFTNLGLKDQIGLYVEKSYLNAIDWKNLQDKWYLWTVDHLSSFADLEELLTPEFFDV